MWHWLIAPWQEAIDRRALLEVVLLGISGGALGCWIVFYRLSYSAESLAHSLLPGLVIAALVGIPLILGGALGVLVAAVLVAAAARTPKIGPDAGVAVVVTALFGLGGLLALAPATPAGIGELLFGDVLGVSDGDLLLAALLAVAVVAALRLLHGRLLVAGFDRTAARALGVNPAVADAALLVLLAATLVVAVQGLGNLLVVALLIGPAVAARALTRRMPAMVVAAAAIACLAGVAGIYLSYYARTAAGASIALMYLLAAVGAGAVKHDLVLGDRERDAPAELADRPL